MATNTLRLSNMVAPEFRSIRWTNCPCRYRVLFGARNTGKSYTMVEEAIDKILKDPNRNIYFIRQVYSDIKDSCFSEIKNMLFRTGLFAYFQIKEHDMEIVYRKTNQVIRFSGCDRGTSINSSAPPRGYFTDYYFEEAFELKDYETLRQIDGSLRGAYQTPIKLPSGKIRYIPMQFTFMLNPWSAEDCLIYKIFVKPYMQDTETTQTILENLGYKQYINTEEILEKGIGIAIMQSTYKVNKWRAKEYDIVAETMKEKAPSIYKVEFLGMWGVSGDICYPEFDDNCIISESIIKDIPFMYLTIGIDTGYSNGEGKILTGSALERAKIHSAYAVLLCGLTYRDYMGIPKGSIIVIDEYYHSPEINNIHKSPDQLQKETLATFNLWASRYSTNATMFRQVIDCYVDSGDAGTLSSLQHLSNQRGMNSSYKFTLSDKRMKIVNRIRFEKTLFSCKNLLVSNRCTNLIRELKHSRVPEGAYRENINDHAINAMEYATIPLFSQTSAWQLYKNVLGSYKQI